MFSTKKTMFDSLKYLNIEPPWNKVLTAKSRFENIPSTATRINPTQVSEIDGVIRVIFTGLNEQQVLLEIVGFEKICFPHNDFEEFLSLFECLNKYCYGVDTFVGSYNLVFSYPEEERSLTFHDMKNSYPFLLCENMVNSFCILIA